MNKETRGMLIGMVLGDGCLAVRNVPDGHLPEVRIQIKHSVRQVEYAEHKADLLHTMLGGKRPTPQYFDNSGYQGVRFSKSNSYFRILRSWMYNKGEKHITRRVLDMLTDHGLAIWWMDDGSLYMKRRNGKIHAREGILSTYLPLETNQIIAEWLLERYQIIAVPVSHKEMYRLRINTTNLKRFVPILEPYIIPSMRYKIDMGYTL